MKEILTAAIPSRLYLEWQWFRFRFGNPKAFRAAQKFRKATSPDSYSCFQFDATQSLFVHIPKCCGVSICKTLYGNLAAGHTTLEEYCRILEPKSITKYFKFSIVRNPWDRVVSAYFFLKGGGFGTADREWFAQELAHYDSFDQFARNWINDKNIWKYHHFRPQHHYLLADKGKVELDFIGRKENLAEDFSYIASKLGKTGNVLKTNRSQHDIYKDYYSPETRAIVASVYKKDIELLGYSFDGYSNEYAGLGDKMTPGAIKS